ncbi:hypothetical protein PTSG_08253 [Salpingoeca rosetta]|uniref:CRIB domain-containing protein n=1 Tax=Salpingoeca rosetta (strain ATCC 50818 / BSB-021) TaxID=946362 RepID=F2UIF9_SALR5|nr:uncharacterized protein PTSG_08253 [Salpingoeca rosetta]EGD76908.1 hypothetical protein PTSG_08253 [Salpingoeca rosetta]|eukprot:XP_004991279.1 hypothetical protein PTSG_08253 [Salpingoeca rosetta]
MTTAEMGDQAEQQQQRVQQRGRKRTLPKPSQSTSSSALLQSDAQRLVTLKAILAFEDEHRRLLRQLITDFRDAIASDQELAVDQAQLDLLFPPILQYMHDQSKTTVKLLSARVRTAQGRAVVGDVYHRLFDRVSNVNQGMSRVESAYFEFAFTHVSRKRLLEEILTTNSHPLYSILRVTSSRVFDEGNTLTHAIDAPFLHLRAWSRKLRALIKATPTDHPDAVFLRETAEFFRALSKELASALQSASSTSRPISFAASDSSPTKDGAVATAAANGNTSYDSVNSSNTKAYRGSARLLELPKHKTSDDETSAETKARAGSGRHSTKKGNNDDNVDANTNANTDEDNTRTANGRLSVISRPESFTHVVHMGPDAVLFGGLSAAAKQELKNATPGRRAALVRQGAREGSTSTAGHNVSSSSLLSPTSPSSSFIGSFRGFSLRRRQAATANGDGSDQLQRSRSLHSSRPSSRDSATLSPTHTRTRASSTRAARHRTSNGGGGDGSGDEDVVPASASSPSLFRRGLRLFSRRSRRRSQRTGTTHGSSDGAVHVDGDGGAGGADDSRGGSRGAPGSVVSTAKDSTMDTKVKSSNGAGLSPLAASHRQRVRGDGSSQVSSTSSGPSTPSRSPLMRARQLLQGGRRKAKRGGDGHRRRGRKVAPSIAASASNATGGRDGSGAGGRMHVQSASLEGLDDVFDDSSAGSTPVLDRSLAFRTALAAEAAEHALTSSPARTGHRGGGGGVQGKGSRGGGNTDRRGEKRQTRTATTATSSATTPATARTSAVASVGAAKQVQKQHDGGGNSKSASSSRGVVDFTRAASVSTTARVLSWGAGVAEATTRSDEEEDKVGRQAASAEVVAGQQQEENKEGSETGETVEEKGEVLTRRKARRGNSGVVDGKGNASPAHRQRAPTIVVDGDIVGNDDGVGDDDVGGDGGDGGDGGGQHTLHSSRTHQIAAAAGDDHDSGDDEEDPMNTTLQSSSSSIGRLEVLRQVSTVSLPSTTMEIDDEDSLDFEHSDRDDDHDDHDDGDGDGDGGDDDDNYDGEQRGRSKVAWAVGRDGRAHARDESSAMQLPGNDGSDGSRVDGGDRVDMSSDGSSDIIEC